MELTVNEETSASLRQGQRLLIIELKKQLSKAESLDEIDAPTKFYEDQIALAHETLRLLDDQTDHVAEERTRRGIRDDGSGQMSLDEAVDGAEDAAKKLLRLEQRRALAGALDDDGVPVDASEMDDQDIATWLLDAWEDVEYDDEDSDELGSWPGIVCHEVEPPASADENAPARVVWCAVSTEAGVPRFFYDVDPETFVAANVSATFEGEALFREVRRAWGVLPEEPAPEVRVETEAAEEEDPVRAWARRTCPVAEMDSNTSILLQGMHALLTRRENLTGRLYAAHLAGISDDDLLEVISNTLDGAESSSVAVNIVGQDNVEYVAVEVKVDPLLFTMKRGRKKEALKGDDVLTAIRTMLEIDDPAIEEEGEEAGEPVEAVAGG